MAGTLAWERLGDHFFRNMEGPSMRWNVRVGQVNMRAAPCGGIIAVWDREDAVVRRNANAPSLKPMLGLYNSEGNEIGQIKLDFGPVIDVLIMEDETIIIVTRSGLARHYTEFGKNFVQIHLPASVQDVKLSTCGYTALLDPPEGNSGFVRFASVFDCTAPEPRYRATGLDPGSEFILSSWCLLPERSDVGQAAGVMLVDQHGKVHSYDTELNKSSHRIAIEQVPVKIVSVNPTDSKIAFSDGNQNVVVYHTDFHEKLFETAEAEPHNEVLWVGEDSLALTSEKSEVTVFSWRGVTGHDKPLSIYCEDNEVAFIQETDGVRILGTNSHTLLLPVYRATAETFKLGSLAPSSILYSCVDQIDAGSPRSDQTVKLLERSQLNRAVDTCISAALLEMDPKTQKRLMRAAAFGKSMLEAYDSSRYLSAITKLRIINALRSLSRNAFFVTNNQLEALGVSSLLHRLELRHLWAEAVSIAKLEGVPIEPVYIEWACWAIQSKDQISDEELFAELELKLNKLDAYSHSKMALRALEQGRQKLALSLLENEPVAKDRVMLLLEMNMAQPALEQAIRSGNLYLVDYVLMILAEQLSFPQLMRVIGGSQLAIERQMHLVTSKMQSKDQLHEFLHQMDQRFKSLQIEFEDVSSEQDSVKKTHMLRALESKFAGHNKKAWPDSRACADWSDLITLQRQLQETYDIEVVGKSAADTVTALLKLPQVSHAQKVKTKLGISDRQFWWLRLRALVNRREFDNLWDLAQSKKSPIGYQPFFDACFEAGSLEYAARYVEMISEASVEDKVRMYIKTKHPEQAKELATKSRNPQLISLISSQ